MDTRNLRYSSETGDSIDMEIEHPVLGWIPFTARPDDPEDLGRSLYAAASSGELGDIAPFVPPAAPVPQSVSRRQGRLALLEVGKLETVEQAVEQGGMAAQIEYEADTWERSNAFLKTLWAQLGGTEEELDNLFILAAGK